MSENQPAPAGDDDVWAGFLTLGTTPDGRAVWMHAHAYGEDALSPPVSSEADALAALDRLHPRYRELAGVLTAEDVAALWCDAVDL